MVVLDVTGFCDFYYCYVLFFFWYFILIFINVFFIELGELEFIIKFLKWINVVFNIVDYNLE